VPGVVTAHHQLTVTLAKEYRFTAGPGSVPATTSFPRYQERTVNPAFNIHGPCAVRIIIARQPSQAPRPAGAQTWPAPSAGHRIRSESTSPAA